jgi:hypothetical protein
MFKLYIYGYLNRVPSWTHAAMIFPVASARSPVRPRACK